MSGLGEELENATVRYLRLVINQPLKALLPETDNPTKPPKGLVLYHEPRAFRRRMDKNTKDETSKRSSVDSQQHSNDRSDVEGRL